MIRFARLFNIGLIGYVVWVDLPDHDVPLATFFAVIAVLGNVEWRGNELRKHFGIKP